MRTSDFGFRSMGFTAAILTACFAFSSCSKENISPSTSAQGSDEIAARRAAPSIIRRKLFPVTVNPRDAEVIPGAGDDRGGVISDYKIDINHHTGAESAEDEIRTEGMGGIGRSKSADSNIEFKKYPAGCTFHPRVTKPRTENDRNMEVRTKVINTNES